MEMNKYIQDHSCYIMKCDDVICYLSREELLTKKNTGVFKIDWIRKKTFLLENLHFPLNSLQNFYFSVVQSNELISNPDLAYFHDSFYFYSKKEERLLHPNKKDMKTKENCDSLQNSIKYLFIFDFEFEKNHIKIKFSFCY